MAKIVIEIDCGEKACGNCCHKSVDTIKHCSAFQENGYRTLRPVLKGSHIIDYFRLPECLAAEIKQ